MKKDKNQTTIKNKIVSVFGKNFLLTTILIALVIGSISTYLILTKSNALKNSSADSVIQGTQGLFESQIGRVNVIEDTLVHEDYVRERYD